jgi:hypothetical protein
MLRAGEGGVEALESGLLAQAQEASDAAAAAQAGSAREVATALAALLGRCALAFPPSELWATSLGRPDAQQASCAAPARLHGTATR